MKINIDAARNAIQSGYILVKDSKAKIIHRVNKETGETVIDYKTTYLLQDSNNPYDQRAITVSIAKAIAKDNGILFSDIIECFQWSSLQKNS